MGSHQERMGYFEQLFVSFDNPATLSLQPDGPIPFLVKNLIHRARDTTWDRSCLKNRSVLVTGANSGLGYECALKFAKAGARVIMTARSPERGENARQRIIHEVPEADVEVWSLDMASLESVRELAQKCASVGKEDGKQPLSLAVLNAGAYQNVYKTSEETGFELSLQIHVYATCLLAHLLLPILISSSTTLDFPSRLLLVTSEAHAWMSPREDTASALFSAINAEHGGYKPYHRYHLTKLCLQLWAQELAKRTNHDEVVVATVTPGYCVTQLFNGAKGQLILRFNDKVLARTAEEGARIYLHAATDPKEKAHGAYYSHGAKPRKTSKWSRSKDGKRFQEEVWTEVSKVLNIASPASSTKETL